jgi:hypothetical protein
MLVLDRELEGQEVADGLQHGERLSSVCFTDKHELDQPSRPSKMVLSMHDKPVIGARSSKDQPIPRGGSQNKNFY